MLGRNSTTGRFQRLTFDQRTRVAHTSARSCALLVASMIATSATMTVHIQAQHVARNHASITVCAPNDKRANVPCTTFVDMPVRTRKHADCTTDSDCERKHPGTRY